MIRRGSHRHVAVVQARRYRTQSIHVEGVGAVVSAAVARLNLVVRRLHAHGRGICVVASAVVVGLLVDLQLVRVRVLRQQVGRVDGHGAVAGAKEASKEARLAARLIVRAVVLVGIAPGEAAASVAAAGEGELGGNGEDEEEDGEDGHGKTGGFHLARIVVARQTANGAGGGFVRRGVGSVWRGDIAGARAGAVLIGDGDKDEGACKGKIEEHGEKGRQWHAGNTACDEQPNDGV